MKKFLFVGLILLCFGFVACTLDKPGDTPSSGSQSSASPSLITNTYFVTNDFVIDSADVQSNQIIGHFGDWLRVDGDWYYWSFCYTQTPQAWKKLLNNHFYNIWELIITTNYIATIFETNNVYDLDGLFTNGFLGPQTGSLTSNTVGTVTNTKKI